MKNCLIIENDSKAIEIIKNIADEFTEISFADSAENQDNALDKALKTKPEVVFLNIDSITINIADFILDIKNHLLDEVVFIALSISKEKAYDAYRYNFSDFLLKPLTEFSVRKCLLKHKKKHQIKENETICLKSHKDYQYLNVNEILFLKADNNTTDFYMNDGKIISAYKTLKTFENMFPLYFLRIHKSYIINKNHVSRIHYGKSLCSLNEYKIPFSKTFIDNIDKINKDLSKSTIITLN